MEVELIDPATVETATGIGNSIFILIITTFFVVIAILGFLLPLFVYFIRQDIKAIRGTIDLLREELIERQGKRKAEKRILRKQAMAHKTRGARVKTIKG